MLTTGFQAHRAAQANLFGTAKQFAVATAGHAANHYKKISALCICMIALSKLGSRNLNEEGRGIRKEMDVPSTVDRQGQVLSLYVAAAAPIALYRLNKDEAATTADQFSTTINKNAVYEGKALNGKITEHEVSDNRLVGQVNLGSSDSPDLRHVYYNNNDGKLQYEEHAVKELDANNLQRVYYRDATLKEGRDPGQKNHASNFVFVGMDRRAQFNVDGTGVENLVYTANMLQGLTQVPNMKYDSSSFQDVAPNADLQADEKVYYLNPTLPEGQSIGERNNVNNLVAVGTTVKAWTPSMVQKLTPDTHKVTVNTSWKSAAKKQDASVFTKIMAKVEGLSFVLNKWWVGEAAGVALLATLASRIFVKKA